MRERDETSSLMAHRSRAGRFVNPWPGPSGRGGFAVLAWMLERLVRGRVGFRARGAPPHFATPHLALPRAAPAECRLTWIGHSTFLMQVGGLNILTDPMFGRRASPVNWMGPRRVIPPAVALDDLPPIDLVLLTHDHYDHLDVASVRTLAERDEGAVWCAPLGVPKLLRALDVRAVIERDWFGAAEIPGARVTCLPARHFSGRSPTGRNRTLWCGWSVDAGGRRLWFVGDTGYHADFGAVAARCGPFDAVFMPIGAYDPRWFMRPVHMDPDEAVAAFSAVARSSRETVPVMIAMHWGTFVLTDEPLDEPPVRARAAWTAAGLPSRSLWIMAPGETRVLP